MELWLCLSSSLNTWIGCEIHFYLLFKVGLFQYVRFRKLKDCFTGDLTLISWFIGREIDGLRSFLPQTHIQSASVWKRTLFPQSIRIPSRWISFRMETYTLWRFYTSNPRFAWIHFPFSSFFPYPCSSVEFHVRITFLYSRLGVCRVSDECRIKDVCPQREYYVIGC